MNFFRICDILNTIMTYPGIANIYANSERGGLILMYKRVMIKISGEALAGETGFGLDFDTIGDIAKTIAKCAVGVDPEGSTVYLIVVDGGDYFYSNGISNSDMANLMKGCGASDAMILNKGNNVSAFVRDEDSIELFKVIDKPSDMGLEAAIGNGLVILQL